MNPDPNEPQNPTEPILEPQPDESAQLRAQLQQALSRNTELEQALQPQPQQNDYIQGVAALQQSNDPRDQLVLGIGGAMGTLEERLRAVEARQSAGTQIPPERLGEAEAEFKRGGYKSLIDADAAAVGKAVLAGRMQSPRPLPNRVQTVVRNNPAPPSLDDLREISASQFKEQLKGPQGAEIHRRYKSGQLNVVPG